MARRIGTKLTGSKVRELLASQASAPKPLASEYTGNRMLLADGRVLIVYEDGAGVLYPSLEALESMLRNVEKLAAAGPHDPKLDLLPPADEFLTNVETRAAQVPVDLGLDLTGTEQDFANIDEVVLRLPRSQRLAPEVVTWLVAYVGEYMRRATRGRWSTVLSANAPEPVVVAPAGRTLQPFAVVYLELLRGTKGSIRGALRGSLAGLRSNS